MANEIVQGLWLGDMNDANNAEFFKKNKIGAVLNCTPDVPNYFVRNGVEYMRISVDDNLQKDQINLMTRYMPHAVSFVHKNREIDGKNVFVHCHAGIQRSASVVASYLRRVHGINKKEAINHVISRRSIAFYGGKSINFEKSI